MKITEQDNDLPLAKPVKEHMSIFIDGVNTNIPNRNGFIYMPSSVAPALVKVPYYYPYLEIMNIIKKSFVMCF